MSNLPVDSYHNAAERNLGCDLRLSLLALITEAIITSSGAILASSKYISNMDIDPDPEQ